MRKWIERIEKIQRVINKIIGSTIIQKVVFYVIWFICLCVENPTIACLLDGQEIMAFIMMIQGKGVC
jgi:hypothetical protein